MGNMKRRNFIKTTSLGAVGAAALSMTGFSQPLGANDRINLAVIGVNGRG